MPERKARNATKDWAMYTYIAGDNDLSDFGLSDIREMEKAGASKDVHVAVQIDTEGVHDGSIRYEIGEPDFEKKSHRTVIERLPEQNTGEPRYLANFARWAGDRYPARNRLMVVWNHGAGFMHEPTRDIGYDDSSNGDALTMMELRWALENAGFGTGRGGKLSILGFDACLMNMLEVAYEFTGLAEFVVGSQQTEPGEGWPYGEVLAGLRNAPRPKTAAARIVKAYIESYRKSGRRGVTQSALEIARLGSVGKAVDGLGAALMKAMAKGKGEILEARVKTQGYAEPTYVDLVDLAENLAAKTADPAVRTACAKVKAAVNRAVVSSDKLGRSVERSSGLSVWFPLVKTDYVTRRNEYMALKYAADFPAWPRFLDRLLAE